MLQKLASMILVFKPNYRTNLRHITENRFSKHQNVPFFTQKQRDKTILEYGNI